MLLTGPAGIGKSAVLKALYAERHASGQRVLYIAQASPTKPMLLEIAMQLHAHYHALPYHDFGDKVSNTNPAEIAWKAISKTLNRLQIRDLSDMLLRVFQQQRYILCLDAMESVTPTQKALMLALFETTQILGATTAKKTSGNLRQLWWSFKTFEVPPLDDVASTTIIETFIQAKRMLIEQPVMFRRHVLKAAGGNPQSLHDILCDANKEKVVKKRYIREEVRHEAGEQYVDLTPLALLAGCLIIAWRFVARGLDTPDLYLLAGIGSALFMFLRFFLYRGMTR